MLANLTKACQSRAPTENTNCREQLRTIDLLTKLARFADGLKSFASVK